MSMPNHGRDSDVVLLVKRILGSAVVLLLVGVGWLVVRSRPSSAWVCESASAYTCLHRGTIDLDNAYLDNAYLGDADLVIDRVDDVAVDNSGERLVVSVAAERPTYGTTGVVALVDAASGSVERWLVQGDDVNRALRVAFSPDDTLVGVFVYRLVESETSDEIEAISQLEIYDADSGELVSSARFDSAFLCTRMGFSADNTEAQCGQFVVDTATGQRIGELVDENRHGISSNSRSSWGIGGTWVDVRSTELLIRTRDLGWTPGDPQEVVSVDLKLPSDHNIAWTSLDFQTERVALLHVAPRRSWFSAITSRASQHAPATLTFVEIGNDWKAETIGVGFTARWGSWSTNGEYLVAVDDGAGQFVVVQTS